MFLTAAPGGEGVRGGLVGGLPGRGDRRLRPNRALRQLAPRAATATPPSGTSAAILRLTGQRLWADTLPSEVIVGDVAVPIRPPQPGDPWAAPTPVQVEVPVSAIASVLPPRPTPYRIAAQVNGVRSRETAFTFRLDP